MKQSKLMSWIETCLSTSIGFGISLLAQMIFLPMLGVTVTHAQNFYFALIMTAVSLARGFALRRAFEALHIRTPLPPSILAIAAERRRQIEVEGWDAAHDDEHAPGEIAHHGACYVLGDKFAVARTVDDEEFLVSGRELWHWDLDWWKPAEYRRNLIRACALIVAELDKMDRERKRPRLRVNKVVRSASKAVLA